MTGAAAQQVDQRTRKPPSYSIWGAFASTAGRAERFAQADNWPSKRYQRDPVAFCREVLGVEPWPKQVEILEAVRDHKRVAVRSGHKVGKSYAAAVLALWFFCSFEDARVVLTSTTSRQVDTILWREIKKLISKAKRPINVEAPHELARSGLKAPDFREIVGFTAKEAEAVAGVSGANLLYLPDEASGIPDAIFEAMEGNRAGGARVAMFSNPTRTEGEFYEAFDTKAKFYKTIAISSEDSPNVIAGREVIPGLANREWVDEKREEWGVDSPLYKIRVKGEFVESEDGKILTVHAIKQAEEAWHTMPETGRLQIGLDPAGPGQGGDESVFAVRRGSKVVQLYPFRGLTDDAHLVHLLSIISKHRKGEAETPLVVVDREGPIGAALFGRLRGHAEQMPESFELIGCRASDRASRQPQIYDRMRDELWASLAQWIREGGAIPEDSKLSKELHAPEWVQQITGRLKVTPKEDLKKALERSPDRADAVALACWTPIVGGTVAEQRRADSPPAEHFERPRLDPYGSTDWTRGGGRGAF